MNSPRPDLLAGPRVALVIATNDYDDASLGRLRAPATDADHMAAVLRNPDIGRFQVTAMINWQSGPIQEGIVDFLAARRIEDLVLVYISCHGLRDQHGRLYFAAKNTNKARMAANAISARWLFDQLDDCSAQQQVLIFDCCFSGAYANGIAKKGPEDVAPDLLGDATSRGRGRAVLTASRDTEYSYEGEPLTGGAVTSVFTAGLVEGLRTGSADSRPQDGFISVDEAWQYAADYVRRRRSEQTPQRSITGAEGNIWLARNPEYRVAVTPRPLPDEWRQALESPIPGVRLVILNELATWLGSGQAALAITAREELERLAENDDSPIIRSGARTLLDRPTTPPGGVLALPSRTLEGPRDYVRGVAFSSDGAFLASAGDDDSVWVWELAARAGQPKQLEVRAGGVRSVAFSPSGLAIAAGGVDGAVRIWDSPAAARRPRSFSCSDGAVYGVAFSPDGTLLATAGRDSSIRLWDASAGRELKTLGNHVGPANAVAFSPISRVVASVGDDAKVRLWWLDSDIELDPLTGHRGPVHSVAFDATGAKIVTGGEDGTVRVWNLDKPHAVRVLADHNGPVLSVAVSHDGALIISVGEDAVVRLWDMESPQPVHRFTDPVGMLRAVALSRDGSRVAAAGNGRVVWLWELAPTLSGTNPLSA